jgi:ABC-type multidrug transport system ATPase subunit
MTLRVRLVAPSGEVVGEIALAKFPARVGRDPAGEVAIDEARFPMVSWLHAEFDVTSAGPIVTPKSQKNRTLLNDTPLDAPSQIRAGDRVRLGLSGPTIQVVAVEAPAPRTPPSPLLAPTVIPAAPPSLPKDWGSTVAADVNDLAALRRSVDTKLRVTVGEGGILGRDREAKFHLPHPLVSRQHAAIRDRDGILVLKDLGSANGTYLNGKQLSRPAELKPGDLIDVGPFSLVYDGQTLAGATRSDNVELVARNIRRVVKDRATGRPLTLLHDVNLVVKPREFVGLLGPSGSGKSTLLNILSGRVEPNGGAVLVNGQNLHAHFDALKRDIAVVPQRDILHESLAVGMALQFTAELRLPPDTGRAEMHETVHEMLGVVGLTKRRATLIRHLSGGQVKRASLANELICKPTLLFLDEVTSGLDEQTDRDMMELFRQVADGGKTVVCITHNLANVEATCHLVAILTEGGRLAFYGPPEAAKQYFGVARLGEVYRKLGTRPAEEWEQQFRANALYTEYVAKRLPADANDTPVVPTAFAHDRGRTNPLRQTSVLTRRYVNVWRGDVLALLAMLGQSLLVAVLLGIVFGDLPGVENPGERAQRTANLLFLLNVSCFWLGCNNSAKEMVRERAIYQRERAINLRTDSYYASKFLVLLVIGVVQATLLFVIVRPWCSPEGTAVAQWLILAALISAGTALGLLISAASPTEEVAGALVPVAVIPQIILAGVIAPLTGFGKFLGFALITCFWGRRAIESLLPEEMLTILNREGLMVGPQLLMILAHAAIFVVVTVGMLWYQARLQRLMARWGK